MKGKASPAAKMFMLVPPINVAANLTAIGLTYVYFAVIEPGVSDLNIGRQLWIRAPVLLYLPLILAPVIAPLNYSIYVPLMRRIKTAFPPGHPESDLPLANKEYRVLASKVMDLPLKLAATTSLGWFVVGLVISLAPKFAPSFYPWGDAAAKKMALAIIFVGAPVTAVAVFFALERLTREILKRVFPREALKRRPDSVRLGTLPKLMVVSLMIGTLPVIVVSVVALLRTHEYAGKSLVNPFVYQMHVEILFLAFVWAFVAVIFSIFLSRSVSMPLNDARAAMEKIEKGRRDVMIPVVSNDETGVMAEGFNRMVDGLRERDEIREVFGTYVSPEIAGEALKANRTLRLEGAMREISILVSDLRGFTAMTESNEPETVLRALNRHLAIMTDIIILHQGVIDEFTGDGILVFFGAPRKLENHAKSALLCALEMQGAMAAMNMENKELGLPQLEMGVAINCGELIVGNIGSEKRKKYGALGAPINITFRVEALSGPGEILITDSLWDKLEEKPLIRGSEDVRLKGIQRKVRVYNVLSENPRKAG
jgi:sigma-B regulation protein RsbU (phosphoserine phosphatase)